MTYQLPKVWTNTNAGGEFANINKPTAGATHTKDLPIGSHDLQLYSLATPNGIKVTVMLEELLSLGLAAQYDAWLIDIRAGDQFGSGFVAINPNSKIPALLDTSTNSRVFESGAILLYLAEKFDALLPANNRTEVLNWLFWQMASAPYVGGGFGHFYLYAPEKLKYPIDRFTMETKRQLDLLNQTLTKRAFVTGDTYTIADIAIWPWYGRLVLGDLYQGANEFLAAKDYPHLMAWAEKIAQRSAVKRGIRVNSLKDGGILERHQDTDLD